MNTNEYDERQMETIRDKVGKDAASAVNIGIGLGSGSLRLAREIAEVLQKEWGGYLHSSDVL